MCGIAGFSSFSTSWGDESTLLAMGDSIAHRGPDAHGTYIDEHVGLCHRRLAIIDLSEAGNQPMYALDGDLVLVFNGEIYNFIELRKELEQSGFAFKTKTDTEVILAAYIHYGDDFVEKLNGMFAFALWDKRQQSLILARDRLGKKPIYYYHDGKDIVFASELKAILTIANIPRKIRPDAVYDFFAYQYVPDPKTIFEGIYKLPPAHWMKVEAGKEILIKPYWDLSYSDAYQKTEQDIKAELAQIIQECTQSRMVSDVPLGAFLSGGVDSSGVVALMAKSSDKPVTTCSIGFDSKKYDEVEFAKIVADQYKTDHHEFTVRKTVEENLEHIVSFFDEPFADPSLVPTFFVSELARKQVTVALAGDGGDEVFAGYEKYAVDATENNVRASIPKVLRDTVCAGLAKALHGNPVSLLKRAGSLMHSVSIDPAMGFYVSNSMMTDQTWDALVKDEFSATLAGYHPSKLSVDYYHRADADDHLSRILYTDIKTFLPGDILVKVDRMSMANSLEVRAPLLDYKLIEYAARIPSFLKFNGKEKKYILKEVFKPLLPDDILYRKKMGFSVPLASWLRNELKSICESKLLSSTAGLCEFFEAKQIHKLWQQHISQNYDHSRVLWSMLMFELWWQRYMKN